MSRGPEKAPCFSCGELGDVTVADVYGAADPESHLAAVQRWARSAREAWSSHHDAVRRRVEMLL